MNNLLLKIKKRFLLSSVLFISVLAQARTPEEQLQLLGQRIATGFEHVDELRRQFNEFTDAAIPGTFDEHLLKIANHLEWMKNDLISSLELAINQDVDLPTTPLVKEAKEIFDTLHKTFSRLLKKLQSTNRNLVSLGLAMNGEMKSFNSDIVKIIFRIKNYLPKLKQHAQVAPIVDNLSILVQRLEDLIKSGTSLNQVRKDQLKAAIIRRLSK